VVLWYNFICTCHRGGWSSWVESRQVIHRMVAFLFQKGFDVFFLSSFCPIRSRSAALDAPSTARTRPPTWHASKRSAPPSTATTRAPRPRATRRKSRPRAPIRDQHPLPRPLRPRRRTANPTSRTGRPSARGRPRRKPRPGPEWRARTTRWILGARRIPARLPRPCRTLCRFRYQLHEILSRPKSFRKFFHLSQFFYLKKIKSHNYQQYSKGHHSKL
jgi:hypothetical protein